MNSRLICPLILAVILRLVLMPFFYHPDIKTQYFHFQFLSQSKYNIYSHIVDNRSILPYTDTFNYLPLTYFTFGAYHFVIRPFLPSTFHQWLNDWGPHQNEYSDLPNFLIFLKIPYLIFDLITAITIYHLTKSIKLFKLWLFNPLTFYLIYILGNFDILPVFLTLLSYYLLSRNPKTSFLVLGIAVSLKLYPLLFLPFFLFLATKKPHKLLLYSFLVFLPLFISIMPFLFDANFWHSFFGSGLTQKLFEVKYFAIPLFPVIYSLIFLKFYFIKPADPLRGFLYLFLLFVSLVNFHPQWLLWFMPLIFINPVFRHFSLKFFFILLITTIFFYIFLINDNFLTFGHLIAIDPQFINLSTPYQLLRFRYLIDPASIQHFTKSAITVISLILVILYEKTNHHIRH